MNNEIKINNPLRTYNAPQKTSSVPTDTQQNISGIVDPQKATKINQKDLSDSRQNIFNALRESNFNKFALMVKNSPTLIEELKFMLLNKVDDMLAMFKDTELEFLLEKFNSSLDMDPVKFMEAFKQQFQNSVKFNSPFFEALKNVLVSSNSPDTQTQILTFMKEFDIMTSYENILKSVENHLQDIEKNIPSSVSQNLKNLINQLEFKSFNLYEMFSNKDVYEYVQEKNLNILKRDIIPFISKYIKTTHDMGQVRDSITLLTLAVAKYESTNINNFEKTLDMLFMNSEIKEALGLENISELKLMVVKSSENSVPESVKTLLSLIDNGMKGKLGYENIPQYQSILNNMLLNESVYMPLIHSFLPAKFMGKTFMSEVWIDPDAEKTLSNDPYKRLTKIFMKFDIENLGAFEMILNSKEKIVEYQLFFPKDLTDKTNEMKDNLNAIFKENGFKTQNSTLQPLYKPKTLIEVFPVIAERNDSINVTI